MTYRYFILHVTLMFHFAGAELNYVENKATYPQDTVDNYLLYSEYSLKNTISLPLAVNYDNKIHSLMIHRKKIKSLCECLRKKTPRYL